MRDFHKTHPSSYGVVKIIPSVTSEGTSVKPGAPDVTKEESSESKAESWGNDEDDSNNEQDSSGEDNDENNDSDDNKTQSDKENESNSEHETDENESGLKSDQKEDEDDEDEVKDELIKTPSNDSDDEDETKITDKAEGDEDEEIDYTTSQLYDDVDIRLNKPVDTDKEFVQEEVFSTVIPQSFLSFTPPPQQSTSTPPPTTEATNPPFTLLNFTSVFQFNNRVTTLEKEVVELKNDDLLNTQLTALVDEHLDSRLGATKDEFMRYLSASITARITE
ncbi:hypothetical protein Tco_1197719 [Tanacetum coccineum]